MKWDYEAIVIGSGFGGAINSLRLAKKWPGKVMLVERGKRYGMGQFPRSPKDMAQNFFNLEEEAVPRPNGFKQGNRLGMFDIRSYEHIDVVVSAGYGGGSLIYANVFMAPPEQVFDERWPSTCKKADLEYYYQVCKEVLGSRPIPSGPEWDLAKTKYFQRTAKKLNRDSQLVDINVFFGPDQKSTLPPGTQTRNKYGAIQNTCNYCSECDVGCNTQSKNTLDLNYLYVAEHDFSLNVKTETKATKITPLDADGHPKSSEYGQHGYQVEVVNLISGEVETFSTRRVVVSAGTLGTNELLLKCRDEYRTLPRISSHLGQGFSGNGDFLSFVFNSQQTVDSTRGPVITQRIDFNLFDKFDKDRAFIMEDASYPNFLAWFVEGEKPAFMKLGAMVDTAKALLNRALKRPHLGRMGGVLSRLLGHDLSSRSSVHLCMGYDKSNGTISLDNDNNLLIDWPYQDSMELYRSINRAVSDFSDVVGASDNAPLPTWLWPARRNVSVHPLGGCKIGDSAENGVTDCHPQRFGQIFHYQNLYVADGSILPTAVGANPSMTIAAMSERVAEAITKIKPDSNLKDEQEVFKHAS